jgi:hypothetical protein
VELVFASSAARLRARRALRDTRIPAATPATAMAPAALHGLDRTNPSVVSAALLASEPTALETRLPTSRARKSFKRTMVRFATLLIDALLVAKLTGVDYASELA